MKKILIADDHDLVRGTIAEYLRSSSGFEVFCASSLQDAIEVNANEAPFSLILLDYSMPGMEALSGLEKMQKLVNCPIAIISGTAPPDIARTAIKAGADGFLPKTLTPAVLLAAVQHILDGNVYIPEELSRESDDDSDLVLLTPREKDVLIGLAQGLSNKEIARNLDVQEVTVKLHVKTLSRKLGARNRTHAAMLARDKGLL
ncbi:Nitrate/nitrite response regulator protein NarL [Roseovarius albus]|uniref:Nitrate/nitrite response regulator protein NarL n=1 Tax=Roseovarius albus TaxID=1247867 RepID=A0A1X6Z0J3_9RHOB|nr:response regulator transcription factor [Roseovarius albus]SLN37244.1 Nitrate/nitrite response regulator protein NarL [Roseovarius albus]